MRPSRRLLIGMSIAALYVIWGSTYLGIRFAVEGGFPPLLMGGIRFLTAGLILFEIARRTNSPLPSPAEWRAAALIGGLLLVGGFGMVSIAEALGVGSGVTASAVAAMPLWAALWGGLFRNWPRKMEWMGLLIGFGGVALLSFEGDFTASTTGLVLVIVSPVMWAFGSVLSRRVRMPPGRMGSAAQMLAGGALLLIGGFLRGERFEEAPTLAGWLAVAYLAVFGSIVAYTAYMYLLATVRPALANSYAYVNPVVAVALGITLGSETITGWTLGGLPVILAGVVIVAMAQRAGGLHRTRAGPGSA